MLNWCKPVLIDVSSHCDEIINLPRLVIYWDCRKRYLRRLDIKRTTLSGVNSTIT